MIQTAPQHRGHLAEMKVETDPTLNAQRTALLSRFRRNAKWYDQRAMEIERDCAGKYVCVCGDEMFAGDELLEVLAEASAKHPEEDAPYVHYVPRQPAALMGGAGLRLRFRPTIMTSSPELIEDEGDAS